MQVIPTSASNIPAWIRQCANAVNGLVKRRINDNTITAATTLDDGYDVVLCDATTAAFTVTLPTAALGKGKLYYIVKTDASANAVTIDGAETINGAATQSLASQWDAVRVFSSGSEWFLL